MRVTIALLLDLELYQLEEAGFAELRAAVEGREVYSWKTVGRSNWLERRYSIADILGYVILPTGLPKIIDMPDDAPEKRKRKIHRRGRPSKGLGAGSGR
ncbi:MAG: hypothetical protein ACREJQ_03150 [bacterium]